MTALKFATVVATTLIATASFTGLASAQAASSPNGEHPQGTYITVRGYGGSIPVATLAADRSISSAGCKPEGVVSSGKSGSEWYALVLGYCAD